VKEGRQGGEQVMEKEKTVNEDEEDDDAFTVAAGLAAIEDNREQDLAEGVAEDEGAGVDGPEDATQKKVTRSDPHKDLRYRVVAILGCQASGKSTLLNHVFGTSFPVLNATATGIQVRESPSAHGVTIRSPSVYGHCG
jgi:hypothetical protein